jgi:group I intron endonuclease
MPRKPKDYTKGVIYQITNDVDDALYIGSTCDFENRKIDHKKAINCKKNDTSPLYLHIRKLGFEHFSITVIEYFPCENEEQLRGREDYHLLNVDGLNVLNRIRAKRSKQQYVKEMAGERKIYNKQYRKEHSEQRSNYNKNYRLDHTYLCKTSQKQCYDNNKQTIKCECGTEYIYAYKQHKSQHESTKKHINYMNSIIPVDPTTVPLN